MTNDTEQTLPTDAAVTYRFNRVRKEVDIKGFESLSDAFIRAWRDSMKDGREPLSIHWGSPATSKEGITPEHVLRAVMGAMGHAFAAGVRKGEGRDLCLAQN